MVIPTSTSASASQRMAALHRVGLGHANHRLSKRELMDLSAVLELWLEENQGTLYPSRQQKERIATDTSMSYSQVNRWFANRRRKQMSNGQCSPSTSPSMESVCSNTDQSGAVTPPQILDGFTAANDTDNRLSHELSNENQHTPTLCSNNNMNINHNHTITTTTNNRNTLIYEQYMQWMSALSAQWTQQHTIHNALQPMQAGLQSDYDMQLQKLQGKQRLALLDVHNLTELETLAVAALANMAQYTH